MAKATNRAVKTAQQEDDLPATASHVERSEKESPIAELHGNMVLSGVGGQGIITASNTISFACMQAGLDVKKSEVHGMSQRGGTVVSHLRFGPEVHSVMLEPRQAEWILGFEWEEGLRFLEYLKPGGVAFISTERRIPPTAQADRRGGKVDYALELTPPTGVVPVDTYAIAGEAALERPAIAQTVLLGALSVEMGLPLEIWREAIAATVPPKTVEANWIAFENGRSWYERWKQDTAAKGQAVLQANGSKKGSSPLQETKPVGGKVVSGSKTTIEAWRGGIPRVEITRDWCKGCNICVAVCPERVLSLDHLDVAVATNPDRCTGCGLCARLCPDMAIEIWLDVPTHLDVSTK